MFEHADFDDHEAVMWVADKATGLRAIIALHSTALGPAMGGCRLWTYGSDAAALGDALRLSRGMSMKNAMAGLPLGGGKSVILGPLPADPSARAAAFEAFGRAIARLGGAYVTAEDVGVSVDDMTAIARETSHVSGLPQTEGAVGGDPSPFTARGVLRGIEAAVASTLGRTDLDGVRVAVQGVGHVGGALCDLLAAAGARLVLADIDADRLARVCQRTGAVPLPLDEVLLAEVDVVAPCALGGAIDAGLAARLRTRVVAGAANNQLATPEAGAVLHARGILYAPDYVINAGGIIAVGAEYLGGRDLEQVMADVDAIGPRIADLLARARAEDVAPEVLANRAALARIVAAGAP